MDKAMLLQQHFMELHQEIAVKVMAGLVHQLTRDEEMEKLAKKAIAAASALIQTYQATDLLENYVPSNSLIPPAFGTPPTSGPAKIRERDAKYTNRPHGIVVYSCGHEKSRCNCTPVSALPVSHLDELCPDCLAKRSTSLVFAEAATAEGDPGKSYVDQD